MSEEEKEVNTILQVFNLLADHWLEEDKIREKSWEEILRRWETVKQDQINLEKQLEELTTK